MAFSVKFWLFCRFTKPKTVVPRLENHSSFLQRRTKPRDIQIVISSKKSVKNSFENTAILIFHEFQRKSTISFHFNRIWTDFFYVKILVRNWKTGRESFFVIVLILVLTLNSKKPGPLSLSWPQTLYCFSIEIQSE